MSFPRKDSIGGDAMEQSCCYCGATDRAMVMDHVVPRSRGGPDTPDNLILSCGTCNGTKSDRLPSEWLKRVPPTVAEIERRVCAKVEVKARRGREQPGGTARQNDPLAGCFFHSRKDDGAIEWQGQVLGRADGKYVVRLFSWADGCENGRRIVDVDTMSAWTFYGDAEEMRDAYDDYASRRRNSRSWENDLGARRARALEKSARDPEDR